jgi:hypothetical protein
MYYLAARRVVLRCFYVKSAMLRHIFVGPASPTPTPMCPSREPSVESISGPDLLGLQTPVSKVLRSEAEIKIDEPTKRVPRHN